MSKVSRNEACPCGSGQKYKACCGKGEKTRTGVMSGRILALIIGVVVLGGVAIAINQFRNTDLAIADPEPWEYDPVRNQHFDPTPGHGHWHDGPPPDRAGGNLVPSATPDAGGLPTLPPLDLAEPAPAPAPAAQAGDPGAWDYDAENDRHWNPNTRVWDQGMPPLEAFTSGQ